MESAPPLPKTSISQPVLHKNTFRSELPRVAAPASLGPTWIVSGVSGVGEIRNCSGTESKRKRRSSGGSIEPRVDRRKKMGLQSRPLRDELRDEREQRGDSLDDACPGHFERGVGKQGRLKRGRPASADGKWACRGDGVNQRDWRRRYFPQI